MADTIVQMDFSGNLEGVVSYSGSIDVDYTGVFAKGLISVSTTTQDFTFSTFYVSGPSATNSYFLSSITPVFSFPLEGFDLEWQGELPVQSEFEGAFFFSSEGSYSYSGSDDPITSTVISGDVPCFAAGTLISTVHGEVEVERLRVGDEVLTASGLRRPILWIGCRRVDVRRHRAPKDVAPVRVRADAFGDGLPRRELRLSPGHNIASEGALMPISALVNGLSVTQVEVDAIEYWHVELDAHDILLAEGLPAESYLDCGNRSAFANGGAFIEAHPDFKPKHWADTCLPLVKEGPKVIETKARLLSVLQARGFTLTQESEAHLWADGRRLEPIRISPTRLAFIAPAGAKTIALRSHAFVPAHATPENMDLRELGLCVARLQIDGVDVRLDCDEALGAGWHEAEWENGAFARRWTNGDARLPAHARMVIVDLAEQGLYWRARKDPAAALVV